MIYKTSTQTHNTTHEGHFNIVYMNNSTSLYIQKWVWVICWLLGCSRISQRNAGESTVPLTNRQCQGLWDMLSCYKAPVQAKLWAEKVGYKQIPHWRPTNTRYHHSKLAAWVTWHPELCTTEV